MSSASHTYNPKCRLAPIPSIPNNEGMTPIVSQFFYSSLIPIDEPLSTPLNTGVLDGKSSKRQFRPFGRGDNNALEKTWSSLATKDSRDQHEACRKSQSEGSEDINRFVKRRQIERLVQKLASQHLERHGGLFNAQCANKARLPHPAATSRGCCSTLRADISEILQQEFCELSRKHQPELNVDTLFETILDAMKTLSNSDVDGPETGPNSTRTKIQVEEGGVADLCFATTATNVASKDAGGVRRLPRSFTKNTTALQPQTDISFESGDTQGDTVIQEVVVGISRLHKVALPTLHMKPIYWSPVNDVVMVMRATWFYRDTMMPVAPTVANQLEAGYQELRPWTVTWRDELRCAIELGPLGEEKISYCLWPQDSKHLNPNNPLEGELKLSTDPFCAARCFQGDAAAQGTLDPKCETLSPISERPNRAFSDYHVVYKDEQQAFLLKPTLRASAYYGRKPASKIAKGFTVGIPVVRGFDRQTWDRINGQSHASDSGAPNTPIPNERISEFPESQNCEACTAEKDNGQVTDLIFVAHGIGQKIAERVESYHFTHAINSFRRAVNLEMCSPTVQRVLRQGHNGAMILPLNWRTGLSFEDDNPVNGKVDEEPRQESFGLKDIEPNTIPAIRSMISDVMLDIPFYMSHHKNKMISALVSEANRIYRLWCQNNPGFSERGKVHLIAHSLGSVMAVDILSRQPTVVPRLDPNRVELESQFFEFDTTNLFLLGSPAGFFLLLERGALTPRRGRRKPGSDPRDVVDQNIVSDAGRFGCLAVDNIYNVLAKEDPIAYLLNGAVDPAYAAALKQAFVPSTSASLFKSMADAVRQIVPGLSPSPDALAVDSERPSAVRLPSQLELEVHDFTREEIAEKRAFLLNDNGQIDWFLKSGSGPLEIQYLNMLSAHTSYWVNHDFIRMLCIEIGRQPGRSHSIPALRAVKTTKRFSLEK
ncbi:hypothetical protein QQS21_001141 [Conoideocrella luteorostrata]|uniref:DDHD domain-containing protein n=1 Tax=Conoideocrella luteorostrata TaxID=1105319 RepID=A0AAJ0CXL8_9HYPO|nr:hypothetical protein QQS21_001141 [Conoideocrella luteorostrata]